ncbi:MAG: calcium-translocating P-type ATPase, PMCA-type [Desulfobacterales bacterium]|nr:calcium-translocating P-type ATPase, PMCA-type [Desulfobacterales bacterium]
MEYNFKGLGPSEVEKSRKEHGSNTITSQDVETFWEKLIDNFKDPMILILVIALGIVTVLAVFGYAEWYEGVGIASAVVLATFVATASEHKNEQTFQKLQEEASKIHVNVFRGDGVIRLGIDDVVVDDLVLLQPGDKICADGKLIAGEIKVNQAMFTGEPKAVKKEAGDSDADPHDPSHPNRVLRGTTVEDGEAVIKVDLVGDKTHFGMLAKELTPEDRKGPLRVKLGKLADDIAMFGYIGASFIVVAFMFKVVFMDNNFQTDLILQYISNWKQFAYDISTAAILAVIIIVVAVPEGLPMMIAIVLSQNMRKLLNSNVLVRQLLGIETTGSLNLLFCDKTGTITKGKLEAVNFMVIDGNKKSNLIQYSNFNEIPEVLKKPLDLNLRENGLCVINPHAEKETDRLIGGNLTERALLQFIGADKNKAIYSDHIPKLLVQVNFNPERKFSAAQVELDTKKIILVKGAAEKILDGCSLYYNTDGNIVELPDEIKANVLNETNKKAEEGFRIIGVATSDSNIEDENVLPKNLALLGFISLRDELREEAKTAIETLTRAGIHVVMLTGDRLGTARAISRDVGLITSDKDIVIESADLAKMSDDEISKVIPDLKVIARCLPKDKKRLVTIAQNLGLVVGMTGDGVNDSPALSKADIGFGMGSGSEVAKEASEIVILDDNISSIANGVHYGRTIYRSIQKFITFQLTVNVGAILIAFLGPFLGFKLPLTMIQLLWINLIMDTLAALAFSGEPPLPKHMAEKPKKREENIIEGYMWSSILINGIFITLMSVMFLKSTAIRSFFNSDASFLTGFFGFFVFINNFNKFNVRVDDMDLFHHIFENKGFLRVVTIIFVVQIIITYFGGDMFRTVPLALSEWIFITCLAFLIIPFDAVRKSITILLS